MKRYRIAVLPGDGIGREIMPHAAGLLEAVTDDTFALEMRWFPWGCEHYLETGVLMPPDGIDILRGFDAIYLVAAGHPQVTDYRSQWEFIFVIRKRFNQYVNLRPVRSYPGVPTLLARQTPFDIVIIRENSEGEYAGPGGIVHEGLPNELAVQVNVFSRTAVERIARYAFELARTRRRHVTNVTKSNALRHGMVLWDQVCAEVAARYPDVRYDSLYVDAASMKVVQDPAFFDVILSTNLFGDILSDLGGAIAGSIGLSPSGSINPEREFPSLYEPVHGSAPDIAGKGIANPIGTILSGALMLRNLGEGPAADRLEAAVQRALADGIHARDLGGDATTAEVAAAVRARL